MTQPPLLAVMQGGDYLLHSNLFTASVTAATLKTVSCGVWLDVLVYREQVLRIVFRLDPAQTGVVVAVRRLHSILSFVHHEVDVGPAGRVGMQRFPIASGPRSD